MTTRASYSLSQWKFRHSAFVWVGIVLNVILAVPLLIAPQWISGHLGVPAGPSTIWSQFAGGLLIILSVFYVPMTLDLDRYRIFAWLAVFPSRTFSVLFFLGAVLTGAPSAFITIVLLDGIILGVSLYCLIQIVRLEQGIADGQVLT